MAAVTSLSKSMRESRRTRSASTGSSSAAVWGRQGIQGSVSTCWSAISSRSLPEAPSPSPARELREEELPEEDMLLPSGVKGGG